MGGGGNCRAPPRDTRAENDRIAGRAASTRLNATLYSFVLTMPDCLSYLPVFCVFFSCIFC